MKKVLVTGASGTVGQCVIKYLLSEGKYEITAVDLPNKKSFHNLKKYHKRINVIYGDILDRNLTEELVKDCDYIIHLASCLPSFSSVNKNIANLIDFEGTENIVRAINYYNKNCFLIYGSSTSIYNSSSAVSIKSKITYHNLNYYDKAKHDAEKYIIKNLKNYCILRLSLVVGDLRNDPFIYSIKNNNFVEIISKEDASYAFVKTIDESNRLNKKILNIGGGDTCTVLFKDLKKYLLKYHGFNKKYFIENIFVPKDFNSPVLLDSIKSNEILSYQNDSLESILMKIKRKSNKRYISKFIGKILTLNTKKED